MIRELGEDEKRTMYPAMFEDIFGYYDEKQLPKTVLVHEEDGETISFLSGYMINLDTFYIAFSGTYQKVIHSFKHLLYFFDKLKENGINWVTLHIENINTVAARLVMGIGFIPYGIKVAQGKIFIEYYKEL